MIISFTIIILLYVYYCIRQSNKYSMSQSYFQIVDKLLFFGQLRNSVAQKMTIRETSENTIALQAAFFLTQKNHDIVACDKWPGNTGIQI